MKNNLVMFPYLSHTLILMFVLIIKVNLLFFLRDKGDCSFPPFAWNFLNRKNVLAKRAFLREGGAVEWAKVSRRGKRSKRGLFRRRGSEAGVFAKRRSNENRKRFSDKKIGTVAVCSDAGSLA